VTLAELRANPALKKMKLLKNVRLIISLLTDLEYQEILRIDVTGPAGTAPVTAAVTATGARAQGRQTPGRIS